jgi:ABC-type lipoprotein release transport system permease subunit
MHKYVFIAWRNLWRTPRRTVITASSFVAGLWAVIVFFAFMDGMDYDMLENAIKASSGHIKIHQKGYRDEPELVKTIREPEEIYRLLDKLPYVHGYTGRVNMGGLISSEDYTTGISIIGIDPEREKRTSSYREALKRGDFLDKGGAGIIIGVKLAERLDADIGSEVSIVIQAADGSISARNYTIEGVYSLGDVEMDQAVAMMDIEEAQELAVLGGEVSEIVVLLEDSTFTDEAMQAVVSAIDMETFEVFTWRELIAFTIQLVELMEAFKYVLLVVLVVVIFFGILNTILMAVTERTKEFGILLAIGMKPHQVVALVLFETVFLCFIAIFIGIPLGIGTSFILGKTGIDLSIWAEGLRAVPFHPTVIYPFVNVRSVFLSLEIVVVPGVIASLFPALRVSRLKPVAAIRHI